MLIDRYYIDYCDSLYVLFFILPLTNKISQPWGNILPVYTNFDLAGNPDVCINTGCDDDWETKFVVLVEQEKQNV